METNLRQADARVDVEGILADMKLEEEFNKDLNCNQINGYLDIQVDDVNTIRLSVSAAEKKKNGDANSAFAGLQTIMNEYRSIASVGKEEADRICTARNSKDGHSYGQLNMYYNITSGRDAVNYKCQYFNRVTKNYEPHATFVVEMYIQALIEEEDKEGNSTGRVLVKGWVPTYNNGVESLTLVAPEDIADAINNTYEPGQTVSFSGDIINSRVEVVNMIPMVIGKPRIEKTVTTKNELVITGASAPYEEGETLNPPYSMETIKLAIQERKDRIETRKAEAAAKNSGKSVDGTKPSGASRGRTLNLNDMPF